MDSAEHTAVVLSFEFGVTAQRSTVENQPPESVRVIKLIDSNVSPSAPSVNAQVSSVANTGEAIKLSAQSEAAGVPAVGYRWDFGDGTSASGPKASHAYTRVGNFTLRLTVDGVDGLQAVQSFSVKVTGNLTAFPNLSDNRRFPDPTDQ